MRTFGTIVLGTSLSLSALAGFMAAPAALAEGAAPKSEVCNNKENPPTDATIQGGCIAVNRTKGNCQSCHAIKGIAHGDIAPPLVGAYLKARFPDKTKLRAQIWDATVANPKTVMPPFGRHGILSEEEIDKVVLFLQTL